MTFTIYIWKFYKLWSTFWFHNITSVKLYFCTTIQPNKKIKLHGYVNWIYVYITEYKNKILFRNHEITIYSDAEYLVIKNDKNIIDGHYISYSKPNSINYNKKVHNGTLLVEWNTSKYVFCVAAEA